jgi:hypothetical protein
MPAATVQNKSECRIQGKKARWNSKSEGYNCVNKKGEGVKKKRATRYGTRDEANSACSSQGKTSRKGKGAHNYTCANKRTKKGHGPNGATLAEKWYGKTLYHGKTEGSAYYITNGKRRYLTNKQKMTMA